jgi:hypothetical protein
MCISQSPNSGVSGCRGVVIRSLAIVCLAATCARGADQPLPPRVFSHPNRIRYDSQCFTIEGKDTFIFSGAFHYFRCPKELWNDRFDKIKAAGFNTVETYAAWNAQEPEMPSSVDDYSKVNLKDLDDWLTMAEAHGLYVILRPGPYICAEWDCGGFPQWLITKRPVVYKGFWLRSDEPTFVAWSDHWYHAVDQIAVKHQLTHRAPGQFGIILYQLENEYGGNQPDPVEVRYLRALGRQAISDGIDVPLFTCWTGVVRGSSDPILRQVYDSANFYPRFNVEEIAGPIAELARQQPDAPLQTTELQGGWFGNVGKAGTLSRNWTDVVDSVSPAQIQNLTLYAIEKGDRVTNYYMLFGGTNFGDFAPHGITTSYDYSAPIREIGAVGEKYRRVAAIGAMLQEHGERLARAHAIQCQTTVDQNDVTIAARRAQDGSIYFFIRTTQHLEPRRGKAHVKWQDEAGKTAGELDIAYDLEPFGSKILYVPMKSRDRFREWLPKPVADIKRPTDDLPSTIKLTRTLAKPDPGPVKWEPLNGGSSLEQLGIYDRRFVFYRTHISCAEATRPTAPPILGIVGPSRDSLLTFVNGTIDPALDHPGADVSTKFRLGDNTIDILYENSGQPNGGTGMEQMAGIRKIEKLVTDGSVGDWRMTKIPLSAKEQFRPEQLKEMAEGFDDAGWTRIQIHSDDDANQLAVNEEAVFRGSCDLSADQISAGDLNVQLTRMDDEGWVFINGKKVGEGHDWSTTYTFQALGLHEGRNTIAVVVRNTDGNGGLGTVKLLTPENQLRSLPIQIGTESSGHAGQWWKSDLDETGWVAQSIGQSVPSAAPLTWYRTKFALPQVKNGIWVPWVARLDVTGNGFLYLNDHALGRYWQAGPQHDFFLPECWLNFGESNVLTMCLRSTDESPARIDSAQIVPVNEAAEFRPAPSALTSQAESH